MEKLIGIDIGGTYIKYGLLDKSGNILKKGKKETPKKDINVFIDSLVSIVEEYKKGEDIIGIGISIPGFIDSNKGIPLVCSNLRFIENVRIKHILEEKTNLPVKVENDANCAALAEKFNGNAKNCSDFVCITVGTGIGGGIYINNKLVSGKTFKGGEFCYMITREEKGYQRANQNSSIMALVNMYKEYKNTDKEISGYDIFKEAEFDKNVKDIINIWYSNLARLIYNISSVLNPEKVLIGGGISVREDLISNLEIQLNKIECWHFVEANIEKCRHRNDAGLIGAAYNFLNL